MVYLNFALIFCLDNDEKGKSKVLNLNINKQFKILFFYQSEIFEGNLRKKRLILHSKIIFIFISQNLFKILIIDK